MKFEVTLKQLRYHDACVNGYNKVVCMLKGIEFDEDKKTHIRFNHSAPISLVDIANNNGVDDALWCLRCNREWDRDSRLFAVWSARQVQHLMKDERSIHALDVAEKHADGNATDGELNAARAAAWAAAWTAARDAARDAAWTAARAAMDAAMDAAWDAAWDAARAAASDAWDAASDAARAAQKEMFIKMCNGEAPWQIGERVE